MTATITPAPSTTTSSTKTTKSSGSLWRPGLKAGVVAAVAATCVAAVGSAAGASLKIDGESIPLFAFAQLTLVFSVVGIVIAGTVGRRASRPRSTFTRTTVVLTVLSLVPDITAAASAGTKVTLMLTHLVAAAIVIPALCSRLPERATR